MNRVYSPSQGFRFNGVSFMLGEAVELTLGEADVKKITFNYGNPETGELRFPLDMFRYGVIISINVPADYMEIVHNFRNLEEFRSYHFNHEEGALANQSSYGSHICTRDAISRLARRIKKPNLRR